MDTPYFFHVIQQTNMGNKLVPGADDWWTKAPKGPSNKDFIVHFGRLFWKFSFPYYIRKKFYMKVNLK